MTGGTISGNTSGDGGGVYVKHDGTFNLTGGTISGNTASDVGGGVFSYGSFTMAGGMISDNTAQHKGGGVYFRTFTMENGTISGNTSYQGGGVYSDSYLDTIFTMNGGMISDNTAQRNGGGVCIDNGTFNMTGGAISNNISSDGGGVYIKQFCKFTMTGGTVSDNTAQECGGGVFVLDTFIITGGMISDNTATYGGGVYYQSSSATFTMSSGTISGNTSYEGGGVYASGTFTMNDGLISDNTSSHNGGGVQSYDLFTMNGGLISGNTAENLGGGVYYGNIFTMNGGTISGNTANNYGGGVSDFGNMCTFNITGGTISDNTAAKDGGGVLLVSTFNISGNPVITENKKGDSDNNVWLSNGKNITVTGPLSNTIPIGVTLSSGTGIFTQGFGASEGYPYGKGGLSNFISDNTSYAVSVNDLGEAELVDPEGSYSIIFSYGDDDHSQNVEAAYLNEPVLLDQITFTNSQGLPFRGWNTLPDGSGSHYADGGKIILTGTPIKLYAQWGNAVEIVGVAEYPTLQDAIDAAGENATVELLTHIDSEELAGSWPLLIGDYTNRKTVTIDLKGFSIDRGLKDGSAIADGYIIKVDNESSLTLKDTVGSGIITGGNNSTNGGGVVVNTGGSFIMESGMISGNIAAGYSSKGGGVYVDRDSIFTMEGGMIYNNTAMNGGGGVSVEGTFIMNDGMISGNTAPYGGGVNNIGVFNMISGTISGNKTRSSNFGASAGGVFNGATFNLSGGLISGNTTEGNGGGVVVESGSGIFSMIGGTIFGNRSDGFGGGVYVNIDCKFNMIGGTISGNTSDFGSGVYVTNSGHFTMNNGMISNNTAHYSGGGVGVENQSSTFTMNGGTISGNTADDGSGGGVSVVGISTFSMTGGTIAANNAKTSGGGVCVSNSYSNFNMSGGTISDNKAAEDGGGVAATGIFNMTGGTIFSNMAANSGGGVYYVGTYTYTQFKISGGAILGNKAVNNGGGVAVTGYFYIAGNPIISGNLAGGGISDGIFTGGDPNNIYLSSDEEITIIGQLTGEETSIGVTLETGFGTFAYAYGYPLGDNDFMKFFSDDPAYAVSRNADGKLFLGIPVYISGISTADKTYDRTTAAYFSGTAVLKKVSGDSVVEGLTASDISGSFADKNVGENKSVSVTGALLSNESYALDLATTNSVLTLKAAVKAKPVTVTGVMAVPRAYEAGNLTVALTGDEVSGKVDGDDVSVDLSAAAGTMADADIGTDKPVTVSGVKLGGTDAGNYVLSAQPSDVTVTISGDGAAPSGNAALMLPSELKEVQASAFEGSPSFDEVYLPDGMETIGSRAFADCSGLKLVHIHDSVTSIADDAFAGSLHVIISCTSGSIGASYARDYYIMRQDP